MSTIQRLTTRLPAFVLLACAFPLAGATTTEYIHTDALGSIVAITDSNRAVLERREYEPFGDQLTPAVQNGPGYTGHVQDAATGLTYMQQRYYDAGVGRFLSTDPVAANPNSGSGFNRFLYVLNNPFKFTDPDGREEQMPFREGSDGAVFFDGAHVPDPEIDSRDAEMVVTTWEAAAVWLRDVSPMGDLDGLKNGELLATTEAGLRGAGNGLEKGSRKLHEKALQEHNKRSRSTRPPGKADEKRARIMRAERGLMKSAGQGLKIVARRVVAPLGWIEATKKFFKTVEDEHKRIYGK